MSTCDVTIPNFVAVDATLTVSDKFLQLMRDSVSEDSLYLRAKDTFAVVFKDLQVNEKEKAEIISGYIAEMSTVITAQAMKSAIEWSKEERDGAYTLSKLKADVAKSWADVAKAKEEVCLVQKQTELQCANITATLAGSLRENGEVLTRSPDNYCEPLTLKDEGLKYEQTLQVNAAAYQILADTFRKSGVVTVAIDGADSVRKASVGDTTPISGGYTNQQTINAERQRLAYEDSKINHMLNSLGVVVGQMMSADINPTKPDEHGVDRSWLMDYMYDGMTRLLDRDQSTLPTL